MSILFEPIEINGMTVSNRFMRSATHDRCADHDGKVTDSLIKVYERLAQGGVGLITIGHTFVSANGKMGTSMLGADRDEHIPGLKRLVDAVHRCGSKVMLQLNHAGRQTTAELIGEKLAAPSAIDNPITKETSRAMDHDEIEKLIEM